MSLTLSSSIKQLKKEKPNKVWSYIAILSEDIHSLIPKIYNLENVNSKRGLLSFVGSTASRSRSVSPVVAGARSLSDAKISSSTITPEASVRGFCSDLNIPLNLGQSATEYSVDMRRAMTQHNKSVLTNLEGVSKHKRAKRRADDRSDAISGMLKFKADCTAGITSVRVALDEAQKVEIIVDKMLAAYNIQVPPKNNLPASTATHSIPDISGSVQSNNALLPPLNLVHVAAVPIEKEEEVRMGEIIA